MMALMMEQLGVEPGSRVMEIGAGTGYNAAILAHVAGEKGSVITMDIDQDIVDEAAGNLSETGYGHVKAVCGDGFEGFPEGGPYDRIIATVGAYDVSPHWVDQLKEGGVSRSGWYPAPGTATASCARSDRATHTGLQYRSAAGSGSASGKQDANQHQSSKGTLGSPWVHDFTTTV